ncbi:MAG: putative RND superfamily exporter protein, partial [Halovenus sp.]
MNLADGLTAVTGGVARLVTDHNRLVVLVMLVLTAGVVFGLTQEQRDAENGASESVIEGTAVHDAETYLDARYFDGEDETSTDAVYIQGNDGSVLNKAGLLAALDYQIAVGDSASVTDALAGETPGDSIRNPAVPVAVRLADEPDPDLATQRQAVADASPAAVDEAVRATLAEAESDQIRQFLPVDYEAGTSDAAGMRLLLTVTDGADITDELGEAATTVSESTPVTVFTTAGLQEDVTQQVLPELAWLVVPMILFVLAVILGFAYRDVTDVVVSFTGVVVTLLWTFGLMGWLGLLGQQTGLVVPVLAIALSIDFSFHVFMRYRERSG